MKNILTIIFILFISVAAKAQNTTEEVKVSTVEMTIVTETVNEVNVETETQIARLYKFKNSRVKKALAFKTKRDRAKMA